ncbi:hypothetical protein K493DRAFT_303299 [Basidiobolus meristosporus CBS 931.73]|uniref:Ankyrin n=1 Tax=Basidiobolus meristosporus CBS 931.73 TaxID=1314790 RepID=A0A1Y1Y3B1_9FUNG|nr:hypothetical protein K493DRAFT_303299 [Basidiobolus meristosporus CBS 931.73]|eukprot:ORX92490.1 hypothetical protein K493DRAFT_303299 [Basidiobolus meristosporus CBS 931.73]
MSSFQEIVKALRVSLSTEIQEIVLFYVGDVVLYFNFFGKPGSRIGDLVISQGGPGFVLEEAIRRGHQPLLRWLLTTVSYPIDYLLTSAVCYGNLGILSYFISLIGEGYKEHDTPAKLLCILKGKLHMLKYLFQENPALKEGQCWDECIHSCLLVGISKSSETYTWYLRNHRILPLISKEDRIKACLQNNNVAGAIDLASHRRPTLLVKALRVAPSGSEETYRKLILSYASEANVLALIARACVRLGYTETLEVLFNEPYNVHVEYDFFLNIPNLAVVEILHKYASQRNIISCLLSYGRIRRVKTRLSTYQTSKCHLKLLKTYTDSYESINQRLNPRWAGQQSEDVLLFLIDLAGVTSSARLVKKYVLYGIECGHLQLLRKLVPLLKERVMRSITQGIAEEDLHRNARRYEMEYPNIYHGERPEVVEYLFELGITQPTHLNPLMHRFDLKFIRNLVERGLVRDDSDGDLVEWNLETKRMLTDFILRDISENPYHTYRSEKGYLMALIRSTWDVFPYREQYCSLESHHSRPVSFSACDKFSSTFAWSCYPLLPFMRICPLNWAKCPKVMVSNVESAIRAANLRLLLPQQRKYIKHSPI